MMTRGTDLVFTVKVTLPAADADKMRRDDLDGTIYESTDEELIADALVYFLGWHFHSVVETLEADSDESQTFCLECGNLGPA